jgi:predicted double-glycine peptidase
MDDGSVSWSQPDSKGMGGWEGFCGQTAVANLLTTHEEGLTSPHEVSRASSDWTPGSKPSTLMRAIKKLSPNADEYEISNDTDLSAATPRNPIVTLLAWDDEGTYHYVSVIGVSNDRVTFNHWGIQDSLSEDEFKKRWGFEMGFKSGVVSFFGGFDANTSIRRKSE